MGNGREALSAQVDRHLDNGAKLVDAGNTAQAFDRLATAVRIVAANVAELAEDLSTARLEVRTTQRLQLTILLAILGLTGTIIAVAVT